MPDLAEELKETAIDKIFAESDAAKADVFKQFEDAFAAAQPRVSQPTKQADATPAASKSSKASSADTASQNIGNNNGVSAEKTAAAATKVPGPPSLGTGTEKQDAPPASQDFSDIPREFKPGQIRADKWNKLHQKADFLEQRAIKAEREVNELKAKLTQGTGSATPAPEFQKQLDAAIKERDSLLERLEAVAVERSPRFEQMFKPRQEGAIELAKQAVGVDRSERITQLLSMPPSQFRDEQLDQIANELTGIRAGKLATAIAEIDKLHAEKQHLSTRGNELFKQWTQEEQSRQKTAQEEAVKKATSEFDSELDTWRKSVPFLQPKDGDQEHNSRVQQRIETAKQVFSGGMDWRDLSKAALWAAIGPDLAQQLSAALQKLQTIESENASLRGSQPNVASDAGGSIGTDADDIPAETSYADAIARRVQQMGLMR